jgi:hypothetical protein
MIGFPYAIGTKSRRHAKIVPRIGDVPENSAIALSLSKKQAQRILLDKFDGSR